MSNAASKTTWTARVDPLDEFTGLGRPVLALHAAVFPLHRERTAVADMVERANDFFEINAAVTERAEVPAALWFAEVQVRTEDAVAAVDLQSRILHVHVVDAVGEFVQEEHGVNELPVQVAGVEVETEGRAVADGFQGPLGGNMSKAISVGELPGRT